jgi:hypothetical protein
MRHRGCGGRVEEDWENPYRFEGEEAEEFGEIVPRFMCRKCGQEILGDAQLEMEN